jgi:hypothetical protein
MSSILNQMDDSAQNLYTMDKDSKDLKGTAAAAAVRVDATLASRHALVSAADMAAVRARLTPEESQSCDNDMINRFLRATDSNVAQVSNSHAHAFMRHFVNALSWLINCVCAA